MSIAENEKLWVAYCDEGAYGPFSAVEVKRAITESKLYGDDCIWKKGWTKWKQIKDIPLYAYESKKNPGTGKEIPDIPVPDAKKFESIISPKVSTKELDTGSAWDTKRLTIVGTSFVLGGIIGAGIATGITTTNEKKRLAENKIYIPKNNK